MNADIICHDAIHIHQLCFMGHCHTWGQEKDLQYPKIGLRRWCTVQSVQSQNEIRATPVQSQNEIRATLLQVETEHWDIRY